MGVTVQPITVHNGRQIIALRVAPGRQQQAAPNVDSLLQAHDRLDGALADLKLVPLANYAGPTPVGFVLNNATPEHDRFAIMRLMVDAQHQRGGYG